MLLAASSFVYQIHLSPLRLRSLAGAPIHSAVQSPCVSRPVSRLAGALYALGWPASSQVRTFHVYLVADCSAGPP
jgi:hypothetical protein